MLWKKNFFLMLLNSFVEKKKLFPGQSWSLMASVTCVNEIVVCLLALFCHNKPSWKPRETPRTRLTRKSRVLIVPNLAIMLWASHKKLLDAHFLMYYIVSRLLHSAPFMRTMNYHNHNSQLKTKVMRSSTWVLIFLNSHRLLKVMLYLPEFIYFLTLY